MIENSPPVVTSVMITPAQPTTDDHLTCTVTAHDEEAASAPQSAQVAIQHA